MKSFGQIRFNFYSVDALTPFHSIGWTNIKLRGLSADEVDRKNERPSVGADGTGRAVQQTGITQAERHRMLVPPFGIEEQFGSCRPEVTGIGQPIGRVIPCTGVIIEHIGSKPQYIDDARPTHIGVAKGEMIVRPHFHHLPEIHFHVSP